MVNKSNSSPPSSHSSLLVLVNNSIQYMNVFILLSASAVVIAFFLLPLLNTNNFADLVVTNAVMYTSDPSLPFADSMAVRNGRILRIGNYSSVQALAGSRTEKLNLKGKVVVPGFIDSHVHLLWGGLQIGQVKLQGLRGKIEFVKMIKEAVRSKKHGAWLLGGGWNNNLWGGVLPEASWIDDITTDNPVWLSRIDGHMGLANSLALKLAGITNCTEDLVGGIIMRTTDGEPSGLLIDAAMTLVTQWIPEPSLNEKREAMVRASNHALMMGVTTVVDMGRFIPGASTKLSWDDFSDVYQWASSTGESVIRVCLFFPMETWSQLLDLIRKTNHVINQWIYLGGVKAFADGSLGSSSALFYEPYINEPNNYGLQVTELESLYKATLAADKSGLQIAIHAIGDKANDLILDLYNSVVSVNGDRDRRFRVEHAQHLALGTPAQFGEQEIIASMQPEHLLVDAASAIEKLGIERAQNGSYLLQSLLANNGQLAFGSDWPVADINPLGGINAAMKRIPPGWENSWISSECISLEDALNAYTISAATACFLDHDLGSLSPGKLADFVVLSADSWDVFAAEGSASIEATYVGGERAYP